MPKGIISDRDKLFTSKFWKSLTAQLGVQRKLSTAYHPQTNGQAERLNQTLEQILRNYVNYQQNNWVELLPMAQFAYNSATQDTTGQTPFYANYGYEPNAYYEPENDDSPAQAARLQVEQLKELHEEMSKDIRFVAYQIARHYNKHRLSAPTLERGDKVYLKRKNIKTQRPSKKLDHVNFGPFKIKEKLGPVTYELELPEKSTIHPVFHAALLEKAPSGTPVAKDLHLYPEQEDLCYEVEKVLDYQELGRNKWYLVKWKGFSSNENTWEPRKNLLPNCQPLLNQFHRQNPPTARTTNPQEDQQTTSQKGNPEEPRQEVRRILVIQRGSDTTPSRSSTSSIEASSRATIS
jgi:Chromo (CHRromatin Organisation MOdifier) domain